MSGAQPQSVGSYLYCVAYSQSFTGSGSQFQATGVEGRPVRVITQGDLAAIVSDSPSDQYDVTLDNVRAHEAVVEEAMQRADVLPVSYGTVAGSDQEVQERLLQAESETLRSQLEHVRNRVEMGVRALWEQDALFAQIIAQNSDIQALREQIVGTTPEQTYDLRIQIGELTDAAIQHQREVDSAAILGELSPLAIETRTNRLITDMMIVNAAFLVDKSQMQAFTERVNALRQASAGRVTFQLAGPLPPYNFISIVVHWATPNEAASEEPSDAVTQ
ncbi:MAG TPA: GvpL/GvpF family gas vesicle protein [Ktedonobacterales bacterium]|nr:GvpL/GvpF family gas vesicle protein [Ktedonobacterales bacterium]